MVSVVSPCHEYNVGEIRNGVLDALQYYSSGRPFAVTSAPSISQLEISTVKRSGLVVNSAGFEPDAQKTEAILKVPRATDGKTLQGVPVNFYRRFLPNLSSVLLLNHLLAAG